MLQDKKIILGISGGIAAYKAAILIRLLKKAGAQVKVVVSPNALEFITELTLQTLSDNPVYKNVFANNNEYSTEHISLSDWADFFILAPATANIIGKIANGIADDALSTTLLAFTKPVYIAPAMNTNMYNHFSVQKNITFLKQQKLIHIIEPTIGELACNTTGKGRMEEPANIIEFIINSTNKKKSFIGKTALVTAGPTYELIDPVRFIGNFSSGKMGFAIAEELAEQGAMVHLITGPTSIKPIHKNITLIKITSAADMHNACFSYFKKSNIIVMAAAVADFTPETATSQKIKKTKDSLTISLKPTKDILAEMGSKKKSNQILVGFALETNDELAHAKKKIDTKNLDLIVLNSLNDTGAGFGTDTNKITIINKQHKAINFDLKTKKEVASDIVKTIAKLMHSK